jgi:hypothetical protein
VQFAQENNIEPTDRTIFFRPIGEKRQGKKKDNNINVATALIGDQQPSTTIGTTRAGEEEKKVECDKK